MDYLILFFIFILGLMVGSFLNVVIFWLESKNSKQLAINRKQNKGKRKEDLVILGSKATPESGSWSLLHTVTGRQASQDDNSGRKNLGGRSFCPSCGHQLRFLDLIPILSWVFLRGKCRYCREKISVQYPLVELGTGSLFVISYSLLVIRFLPTANGQLQTAILVYFAAAPLLIINCLLLTIFVYDLKHKIIPDKVMLPSIVLALCYSVLVISGNQNYTLSSFLFPLFSAFGAGGFFYALAAISDGKWMGGGDIKLAFFMGLLLGWPNILVGLFIGFLSGAIFGIALILNKKAKMQSEIPFGPFLIFGTWIALFWGDKLIKLYLRTLGL